MSLVIEIFLHHLMKLNKTSRVRSSDLNHIIWNEVNELFIYRVRAVGNYPHNICTFSSVFTIHNPVTFRSLCVILHNLGVRFSSKSLAFHLTINETSKKNYNFCVNQDFGWHIVSQQLSFTLHAKEGKGKNDMFWDPQRASPCPFHVTSFRLDNKSLREVIACQIAQG